MEAQPVQIPPVVLARPFDSGNREILTGQPAVLNLTTATHEQIAQTARSQVSAYRTTGVMPVIRVAYSKQDNGRTYTAPVSNKTQSTPENLKSELTISSIKKYREAASLAVEKLRNETGDALTAYNALKDFREKVLNPLYLKEPVVGIESLTEEQKQDVSYQKLKDLYDGYVKTYTDNKDKKPIVVSATSNKNALPVEEQELYDLDNFLPRNLVETSEKILVTEDQFANHQAIHCVGKSPQFARIFIAILPDGRWLLLLNQKKDPKTGGYEFGYVGAVSLKPVSGIPVKDRKKVLKAITSQLKTVKDYCTVYLQHEEGGQKKVLDVFQNSCLPNLLSFADRQTSGRYVPIQKSLSEQDTTPSSEDANNNLGSKVSQTRKPDANNGAGDDSPADQTTTTVADSSKPTSSSEKLGKNTPETPPDPASFINLDQLENGDWMKLTENELAERLGLAVNYIYLNNPDIFKGIQKFLVLGKIDNSKVVIACTSLGGFDTDTTGYYKKDAPWKIVVINMKSSKPVQEAAVYTDGVFDDAVSKRTLANVVTGKSVIENLQKGKTIAKKSWELVVGPNTQERKTSVFKSSTGGDSRYDAPRFNGSPFPDTNKNITIIVDFPR